MKWSNAVLVLVLACTAACAAILGIRQEHPEHPFEHRAHALAGVHCLDCHDDVRQADDDDDPRWPATATCLGCHEKPHDQHDCSGCHGLPYNRAGAERARVSIRFDHAAHATATHADCVRCHADAESGSAVLRPRMAECLSCHGHDEAFAAKDCGGCHVDLRAEQTAPEDHLVHGANFASEHAAVASRADGMCETCHAERFCVSCHTGSMMPLVPARLAFDMPRASGLHRAGFLARHGEESANNAGLCTTCHAPEACASCHERKALKAKPEHNESAVRNPHPPGWIGPPGSSNAHGPATWRDPASCESCHGGAGEQLCVSCHRVGAPGGNPHLPGQRPVGQRAAQPCVRCHVVGR